MAPVASVCDRWTFLTSSACREMNKCDGHRPPLQNVTNGKLTFSALARHPCAPPALPGLFGQPLGNRHAVVHHHPLPEGLARLDEAFVHRAFVLVEILILDPLELEHERVAEGLVRDRTRLDIRRFARRALHEIVGQDQARQFAFESRPIFLGEVRLEPKIDTVNHTARW